MESSVVISVASIRMLRAHTQKGKPGMAAILYQVLNTVSPIIQVRGSTKIWFVQQPTCEKCSENRHNSLVCSTEPVHSNLLSAGIILMRLYCHTRFIRMIGFSLTESVFGRSFSLRAQNLRPKVRF